MGLLTIVEGPDGAGKSALVRKLKRRWSARMSHHGPMPGYDRVGTVYNVYLNDVLKAKKIKDPMVMDRSWISEAIYASVMRGGADRVTPIGRRMIERVAWTLRPVVVLALPPLDVCIKNFTRTIQEQYPNEVEELVRIYGLYESWLVQTDLPVILYDYTRDPTMAHLLAALEHERPFANGGPGVGHWNPRQVTLLVGDQVNPNNGGKLPFVSFTGCSPWLAGQLESWNWPERWLYWINATTGGRPTDPTFVEELEPYNIIALGQNAAAWCARAGLEHTQVPHPQQWRRFYYNTHYPLLEELRRGRPCAA